MSFWKLQWTAKRTGWSRMTKPTCLRCERCEEFRSFLPGKQRFASGFRASRRIGCPRAPRTTRRSAILLTGLASNVRMRKAINHLKNSDPVMRGIIERVGPCRMEFGEPVFHSLAEAIVYQQLNGKAAVTIFKRFA